MRKIALAWLALLPMLSFAQMDYRDSNHITLFGGITNFDLKTDDFQNSAANGWTVGAGIRGNFYNNFDMIYSIQFFENKFEAPVGATPLLATENAVFKTQGVQISLMPSYNIVYNHLSIEAGPVFQVNGKLSYDKDKEGYFMNSTGFTLKEMEKVNTFNFLGAVGVTAGIREVRVGFKYMYGFSNFLGKMNDNLGSDFKSHPHTWNATLTVFL